MPCELHAARLEFCEGDLSLTLVYPVHYKSHLTMHVIFYGLNLLQYMNMAVTDYILLLNVMDCPGIYMLISL